MAKINLSNKLHSMVIFLIKVRRFYRDLGSQADPTRETHVSRSLKTQEHTHKAFLQGLTLNFSRMLGDFIAGSPGEMNYSERF